VVQGEKKKREGNQIKGRLKNKRAAPGTGGATGGRLQGKTRKNGNPIMAVGLCEQMAGIACSKNFAAGVGSKEGDEMSL